MLCNCVEGQCRRVCIHTACTGERLQAVAAVPAAKRLAGEPLRCALVSHTNRLGSRTTASRTTCRHLPVVSICRVAFISASRIPYQKHSMVTVTGNYSGFLYNYTNWTPLRVPACSLLQLQTAHEPGYRCDEAEAVCAAARPLNSKSISVGS